MDEHELIAAGVYDPSAPDPAQRRELLEYLREHGATLEQLRESLHAGQLVGLAAELRRQGDEQRLTPDEVATAAGMPLDVVLAVGRAAGLPTYDARAPVFRTSDVETFRLFGAAAEMFGQEASLQFTRTMGAALASIADAAMASFGINVTTRLDATHATELERAKATEAATDMLVGQVPRAIETLFFHHVEAAVRRSIASTGPEGAYLAQLAVGFLDLAGSTATLRELAPEDLAAAVGEFERDATEIVGERRGRIVKTIGDEVMFVVPDAAAACDAALALREAVSGHRVFSAVRGGLSAGELVRAYGDFYGVEVNRAARIVKLAPIGTVLVTDPVRRLAGDGSFRFEPLGAGVLAGFEEPTPLFALERV